MGFPNSADIFGRLSWLTKRVRILFNQYTNFTTLPVYTDNTAAITGGLRIGQLYRTGDVVKVVHA